MATCKTALRGCSYSGRRLGLRPAYLVPLDSPGTDELGRSGLPGEVNRHFWDRFGAALLISVVDGAMQAAVQSSSRGGGAIIYNPSASQDAITDVSKGTINIAPTVTKHQGDRIQILVARDLDFRPVYELPRRSLIRVQAAPRAVTESAPCWRAVCARAHFAGAYGPCSPIRT